MLQAMPVPGGPSDVRFTDRVAAGRLLADAVGRELPEATVVVALPRGGVPVAAEVARLLKRPLEVLVVRKIGALWQPEWAVGAWAEGASDDAVCFIDANRLQRHGLALTPQDAQSQQAREELQRRVTRYRGLHPALNLQGRPVLLVDDGAATGTTLRAALLALRQRGVTTITVAVPVAPPETVAQLQAHCDRVVCLAQPEPFEAVGCHYRHFPQVQDTEVAALLKAARAY